MAIVFAQLDPITLIRGTAWSDDFTLVDKNSGDPIDLTAITGMTMRIRKSIDSAILAELSVANGQLVVLDAAAGECGFRMTSAQTLDLPANDNRRAKYIYDVVIQRSALEYEPAVTGKLTVNASITRPWGAT